MRTKSKLTSGISIIVLLLLSTLNAYTQSKVTTVVYRYKKQDQPLPSYWFEMLKPMADNSDDNIPFFPGKIISQITKIDSCETICKFSISDTTCAIIADGLMREIIVIPGDSIIINIATEPNKSKLAGKYNRQWQHDVTFSGKNKYIYGLIDSLANFDGDLRRGSLVKSPKVTSNLDSFCNAVKERYIHRIDFTKKYCASFNIPANVRELVQSEIYSSYLQNLIEPLSNPKIELSSYPKEFANEISTAKLDNEHLYFRTVLYSQLATNIFPYQHNQAAGPRFTREKLENTYKLIKKNYTGEIREHQLTEHLWQNIHHYNDFPETVDSLIKDFSVYAKNKNYAKYVDSSLIAFKNKKEIKYTLAQVMASEVVDTANNQKTIQSLLNHKPTVLIGWASWCKPCLAEFPAEEILEKEYGDKVDFIYLSFDKRKSDWKAKSKEMKLHQNHNFLLSGNFKSVISTFYNFHSIPQYLVYNKEGKKIEIADIRPSDKEFKSMLDNLIR